MRPHQIFVFFSLLVGIILVFAIPPIGGIDESQHVRRAADITAFKLLDPTNDTQDLLAIWAENGLVQQEKRVAMTPRWNFVEMLEQNKQFPTTLPSDRQVMLEKNPYTVSNPIMYAPFVLVLKVSELFHAQPWEQFYLLRMTALLSSVFLIAIAIARMPEHRTLLAAACLLPAMMNARSCMNIDGLVVASALLFFGQFFNLCRKETLLTKKDIFQLALFGFFMAQSKGQYAPLLFTAVLLPERVFSSACKRWSILFVVIVPSLVIGLGWSALAKAVVLSGMRYNNDNGEVWPDGQFEWLVTHPIEYGLVVVKSLFASPLFFKSILEAIGTIGWGHNYIVIPAISYGLIIALLATISATEPVKKSLEQQLLKRCFIVIMMCGIIVLSLTMLYVQWSAYQSPVIDGFQGRYLYPLLPLLLVFVKPIEGKESAKQSTALLWVFGLVSSASLLWATVSFYYL